MLEHQQSSLEFCTATGKSSNSPSLSLTPYNHEAGGYKPYQGKLKGFWSGDVKENNVAMGDVVHMSLYAASEWRSIYININI